MNQLTEHFVSHLTQIFFFLTSTDLLAAHNFLKAKSQLEAV
jgi:hypothetical protein